jgi:hypothetical protein
MLSSKIFQPKFPYLFYPSCCMSADCGAWFLTSASPGLWDWLCALLDLILRSPHGNSFF